MQTPKSYQDTYELKNGVRIPCIGYGTYMYGVDHETSVDRIRHAAQIGYRLFDTASFYMNEQGMGEALRTCGVPREELFISSKVWNQDQGYDATIASFNETLEDMQMDYLDMYLIHWPIAFGHDDDWQFMVKETWRAMTDLYKQGKIRVLGVSNFLEHHLAVLDGEEIPVCVNELERNLGYPQMEIHDFCHAHDIVTISYSPLRCIHRERPLINALAEKYGKTPAQIALRWNIQLGSIPIPRAYTYEHMSGNLDVFDFELTDEEVAQISSLEDIIERPHQHPDIDRIPLDRHFKTKI